MKKLLLMVPLALLALALPATGAAGGQGGTAFAPKDCTKPRVEPKRITVTCADGGFFIQVKHWASFNGKEATGKGKAFVNNCEVNCAAGSFDIFAVKIHLTKVEETKCGGRKVPLFSKIEVTFKDDPPKGFDETEKFPLSCIP